MDLQIGNISKTYPDGVQALKNVTLSIATGIYGLVGPADAGKSTLLRILTGVQRPDEGSVWLDGIDVLNHVHDVGHLVGYLTESPGGDSWAIARSPKLLIIDRPLAGLEPAERVRLTDLMRELAQTSIVILSTRQIDDVRDLCTRMGIIHDGRILLEADPRCASGGLCGRIWSREVAKEALTRVQREHAVISTRVLDGRPFVRVYSNVAPGVGYERAKPELEDVYLSALAGHIGARSVPTEASAAS
jgi:ABC-type multidrug transport system ATPase subunit